MADVAKPEPKDPWAGLMKPWVGEIVWHYKACDPGTPAPAMVMALGTNKRINGIRFVKNGTYYEPFGGAVHMDFLIQADGTSEMTKQQKENAGGWRHTDETLQFVDVVKKTEENRAAILNSHKSVVELGQLVKELQKLIESVAKKAA